MAGPFPPEKIPPSQEAEALSYQGNCKVQEVFPYPPKPEKLKDLMDKRALGERVSQGYSLRRLTVKIYGDLPRETLTEPGFEFTISTDATGAVRVKGCP